jgi:hypothetical protein
MQRVRDRKRDTARASRDGERRREMTPLPLSEFVKASLLKMSNTQLMEACDLAHATIRAIDRKTVAGKKMPASAKTEAQAQIEYARALLHGRLVG